MSCAKASSDLSCTNVRLASQSFADLALRVSWTRIVACPVAVAARRSSRSIASCAHWSLIDCAFGISVKKIPTIRKRWMRTRPEKPICSTSTTNTWHRSVTEATAARTRTYSGRASAAKDRIRRAPASTPSKVC